MNPHKLSSWFKDELTWFVAMWIQDKGHPPEWFAQQYWKQP